MKRSYVFLLVITVFVMQLNCAESSYEVLSGDGIETFTLKSCLMLLKNEQKEQFKKNQQMLCTEHSCETFSRDEMETLTLRGVLKGYGYPMICSEEFFETFDRDAIKVLILRGHNRPTIAQEPRLRSSVGLRRVSVALTFIRQSEERKKWQLLDIRQEDQQKKSELNQSYRYTQNRHAQKQLKLQDKVQFKKNKKLPKSQQRMQVAHRTR